MFDHHLFSSWFRKFHIVIFHLVLSIFSLSRVSQCLQPFPKIAAVVSQKPSGLRELETLAGKTHKCFSRSSPPAILVITRNSLGLSSCFRLLFSSVQLYGSLFDTWQPASGADLTSAIGATSESSCLWIDKRGG